jgi:cardiolipin synthase (CMP-forming)
LDKPEPIITIPNFLTFIRALGIPLFLWLYLSRHNTGWSFIVLTVGALTDYFDGKVARLLNQETKLGAALDPAIDRAYIAATVFALAIRSVIPWWMVFLLVARDLWIAFALFIKKRRTGDLFEVSFLGKAATFNLLYAFPFLLLSEDSGLGKVAHVLGWAFAIWGMGLYLFTALQYSSDALRAPAKPKGN